MNLFSGFMAVLDKNLITIQENNIDIKDSLKKVENTKNPKKKISLFQEFINLFK